MLVDFKLSYTQALGVGKEISEEDLIDPERYPWREGATLWVMVAANTSWHYQEHEETIAAYLKEQE